MSASLHRSQRSLRVAWNAAVIYLGYKWTQRRVRGLTAAQAATLWDAQHDRSAKRLFDLAVSLQALMIKAGQFIGARADIVPAPYVHRLGALHDRVPPRSAALIRAIIERELGRPIDELFSHFDDRPLAAASLAQVHRARLPNGRQVVVKVQYPEVGDLVRLDMRNLETVVRLLARRESRFDYRAVAAELAREMPRELDFVHEAEMQRRVAANLAGETRLVVPEVISGMLTRHVLVSSYVDGARVLDLAALDRMGVDPVAVAGALAAAYGRQIMIDGLFQADPHPGNILVRRDGKVALLDFGLTKELPDQVRLGFARLVLASNGRDPAAVLAAFRELGIRTRHDEPASLLTLVRLLFDARPVLGDPAVVRESNTALDHNPINAIPHDLILIGRVIGLLRGVAVSLATPFTPMQMLLPYARAAVEGTPAPAGVEGGGPLGVEGGRSSTVAGG